MKNIFFILCLAITISTVHANEILPNDYKQTNLNPYKNESWFKNIKLNQPNFGRIEPNFASNYNQLNNYFPSKLSNSLARMEQEWFHKEFNHYTDEERINNLEEKIFGTIHDGDLNFRHKQLVKAFNARKSIQAKQNRLHRHLFSGVPTSIPMNANDLFEN